MSPTSSPARAGLRLPRIFLNLLLAGVLLRLLLLGYWSLWLDEGVTWTWATAPTLLETLTAEANHPPLWWAVTRIWIGLFGDGEGALRAPAALLGVVGIGLAWGLGSRLLDPAHAPRRGGFSREADGGRGRRAALWLTAFAALSAYLLEYAQEARMYTALFVEAMGLALLYLRWLDKGDRLSLVGYAVLGALTLHTHYFAVFVLGGHAAHVLWLAWQGRGPDRGRLDAVRPWPFLLALGTAVLLFVPWLVYAITHYERIAKIEAEPFGKLAAALWRMGVGPGVVARGPVGSPPPSGPVETIAATALCWLVPLVLGAVALRRRGGVASLMVTSAVLPLLLLLAVSPVVCLIHERYLVFLAPWVFLLAALGVTHAPRLLRPVLGLGLVGLLAAGVVAYVTASRDLEPVEPAGVLDDSPRGPSRIEALRFLQGDYPYGRTPWRDVRAFVAKHAGEGDLAVLHPGYVHLVWDYYDRGGIETLRLPLEPLDAAALEAAHGEVLRGRKRVFLVMAPPYPDDEDHYVDLLRRLLWKTWLEEEAKSFSATPAIPFSLGWGVRVAVFARE